MHNPDNPWLPRPGLPPDVAAGPEPEPWPFASDEAEPWDAEPWDPQPDDPDLDAPVFTDRVPLFAEGAPGDLLPPGPQLAALTEQAVAGVASLSDAELVGVLRASQRQIAREQYKQALAAAEFGRR